MSPTGRSLKLVAARVGAREAAWCRRVNGLGTLPWVRAYFRTASWLGDGPVWYALMAVLAVADGMYGLRAAAHLALVGGTASLLYAHLKQRIRRPRPFARHPLIHAWVAPLDEFSFPSGHTLHAVGFTLAACSWYPWMGWVLVPFAASVAASRVVLGVHYPSDVLAAALIGGGLARAAGLLF